MSDTDGRRREWPRESEAAERAARLRRIAAGAASRPAHHSLRRPTPVPDPGGDAAELDCLRGALAPAVLQAAARRAAALGVGAEQVLISGGVIDQAGYLRHLARRTGMPVETFAGLGRADCLLADDDLVHAAAHRILPVRRNGELRWVVAPRNMAARYLASHFAGGRGSRTGISLATTRDFDGFLMGKAGGALARVAIGALQHRNPAMSAAPDAPILTPAPRRRRLARTALAASAMLLAPALLMSAAGALLAASFIAFAALRIAAAAVPARRRSAPLRLPARALPVYTVIVALYREASSVAPLLQALDALDYPREKLDIKIVVEPDDPSTRAALGRALTRGAPRPHLQVIVAPRAGPRTKPKALVSALPFAHGSFLTVFDAEDRPEPGQLRAALAAFRQQGHEVACVQASLCIDNIDDNWLARMFGVEYAGQFDAFLPGLATFRLPLPLGGSSNHFRTAALRRIGGWDPYNVTEDADLGMRLARFGYRSATFASTTFEEAPVRFGPWLRQRTRWMKGWMQTWAVHMRNARQLWRDSGPAGLLTLNLMVGGNVVTALVHPLLLAGAALTLVSGDRWPAFALPEGTFLTLHLTAITSGYVATAAVGLIGLARRRQLAHGWVLLLTPLYWLGLSYAAWRALAQLRSDPYRWEKTDHGLARRKAAPHLRQHDRRAARDFIS